MELGKRKFSKLIVNSRLVLLFLGILAILLSLIYSSTILIFLGLTLTFWGFLFIFGSRGEYVKSEVSESMIFSSFSTLNKMIADSECQGKAVYLPPYPRDSYVPDYLSEFKEGLVFIPLKSGDFESLIEKAFQRTNENGLRLIPPGVGLANIFEKKFGASNIDKNLLAEILRNFMASDLELADEFEMDADKNPIHTKISGATCGEMCQEVSKLTSICSNVGCPICSSLACILTRVINRPLMIERCGIRGNVIETWYRILEG